MRCARSTRRSTSSIRRGWRSTGSSFPPIRRWSTSACSGRCRTGSSSSWWRGRTAIGVSRRSDDLAVGGGRALAVEAGDEGGGDRVAVVLGEPPGGQAGEADVGERGGRPFGPAGLAAGARPDRPGGGREGLDEAIWSDAGGLERRVELEPVLDPPVIGVVGEPRALRRPADAADGAS